MTGERLLIIEDDKGITDIIRTLGKEMGFQIHCAMGSKLKEDFDTLKPEVIVMDILMPEMDGLEVLRFIEHKTLGVTSPRIIILSGSPSAYRRIAENLGKAFGLTIDASIAKPFRINDLRTALEKARTMLNANKNPPSEVSA